MSDDKIADQVLQIISKLENLTAKEIQQELAKQNIQAKTEKVNSILYGKLHDAVIRDVDEKGFPTWRIKRKQFSAASGLEVKFYKELLKRNILPPNAQLGFGVKNARNNKRYSLDIAATINGNRYNIEIDGFDHIRADALSSIERQITEEGPDTEIEIDWMDNEKSFVSFSEINTAKVYKWCGEHMDWCIRYHEELLWPKDITRNIWLIDKGWRIIRFWNAQIRGDMEQCIDEIREWMNK